MGPLTPWQRIIVAARAGRGVRLSSEEVVRLALDDAIATAAYNDWEAQGVDPPPYSIDMPAKPVTEGGDGR